MYKYLIRAEGGRILSKFNSEFGKERILSILEKSSAHIHFVGVGGVGMLSLFMLTENMGIISSGSDRKSSAYTEILKSFGKNIFTYHRAENAQGADLLVYTLAVSDDNPELLYASENGIPAVSRAEYLGAVMQRYKCRIGVSGSHGKSTVTAMLSHIFKELDTSPTVLCGANLPESDLPVAFGEGEYFIYEACEYKDSFLRFSPTVSVFTNLELDHVDYFKSLDDIKASFIKAANMPKLSVLCSDSENLYSIKDSISVPYVTYGVREGSDYKITDIKSDKGFYSFKIQHGEGLSPEISLSVPGVFNVQNAAGAFSASLALGLPEAAVASALKSFKGIDRRLEYLGSLGKTAVYYDYAHHPTEIESGIKTVREISGLDVTVIFKPHTYSRTAGLFSEFVSSLSLADRVLLLDIDAIREKEIEGVTSSALAEKIGDKADCIRDNGILSELLKNQPSSAIIMGAADIDIRELKRNLK